MFGRIVGIAMIDIPPNTTAMVHVSRVTAAAARERDPLVGVILIIAICVVRTVVRAID